MSNESTGGAPKKLSTKDILAAARAQAAAASGSSSAESPPAEAAPAQAPSVASPKPAANPAPGKKPTSTAEILAAARAQAAGVAGAAPAAAAPSEAPAAKPVPAAKPKPAAGGNPKSTADILAAARAAAGKGSAPGAEEPAAEKKAAPAKSAPVAAAVAGDGPKLSVAEMLAAVRPDAGTAAAATTAPAATAAAPAKPVKPTVAPPMPAKPVLGKKAPAPDAGRRKTLLALVAAPFAAIGGLFGSAFSTAWTALAATTGVATLATARFMLPNVLTEPPRKFKIGPPADYDLGTVATKWVAQYGIWIVHTDQYKGKNLIYALASVCTHLGCTPSWLEGERKYKCPCHGSGFYITGINFEGPAPRPLERVGITLSADGMLEVDKSLKFQEEMGQWNDPASYLEVVG